MTTPANKWPTHLEAALKQHYGTMPWPQLMALLGKTRKSIYQKAHNLGLLRSESSIRHDGQNFNMSGAVVAPKVDFSKPENLPVRNSTTKGPPYTCPELLPYQGRPGSMRAFSLPSLVQGQQVERRAS